MSAVPKPSRPENAGAWLEWLPVLTGFLILYVPTIYGLAAWLWQQDENAHGPIILAVIAWLIWRERAALLALGARPAPAWGFPLLVFGLLVYVVGRSQEIALFEIGSLAPIFVGVLLAMRGWPAVRALWFPVFFIVFMLPLPGFVVDALTGSLKQQISEISTQLLHAAGYPIARDGVVLTIGQYQLLVADACSGLNSMFSLSALGTLFMYLTARTNVVHNAIMLASILPIAFVANVFRVLILILITYHFGDDAGQSFLHSAAGIVLLTVALGTCYVMDGALAHLFKPR